MVMFTLHSPWFRAYAPIIGMNHYLISTVYHQLKPHYIGNRAVKLSKG